MGTLVNALMLRVPKPQAQMCLQNRWKETVHLAQMLHICQFDFAMQFASLKLTVWRGKSSVRE